MLKNFRVAPSVAITLTLLPHATVVVQRPLTILGTPQLPVEARGCPRRCGGSSSLRQASHCHRSDFGSHVFPTTHVTWLVLSPGGRAAGGGGDQSLQARPFLTMRFSLFCSSSRPSTALRWHCKRYTGRGVVKFYLSGAALAEEVKHNLNWTDENGKCRVLTELFMNQVSNFNRRGWIFIKRIN